MDLKNLCSYPLAFLIAFGGHGANISQGGVWAWRWAGWAGGLLQQYFPFTERPSRSARGPSACQRPHHCHHGTSLVGLPDSPVQACRPGEPPGGKPVRLHHAPQQPKPAGAEAGRGEPETLCCCPPGRMVLGGLGCCHKSSKGGLLVLMCTPERGLGPEMRGTWPGQKGQD